MNTFPVRGSGCDEQHPLFVNAIVHSNNQCSVCRNLVETIQASLLAREVRPGTPLPCAFASPASEKEGIEEALEDACQDLFDHVMLDTEPRGSKEERKRVRRRPGTVEYEEDAATMIPRQERPLLSAGGVVVKCMYDEDTDNIYTTTTTAAANDNNNKKKLRECTALAMPMMEMTLSRFIRHLKDKKNKGLHVWDKEVDGAVRLALFRALDAKLKWLHECSGVVHGDVKTDNVMFGLGRYGEWIDEVNALTELMHEKLQSRRKRREEEEVVDEKEEEDLLAAWTKSMQEIFEESMRLVDFGLSQEIKDALYRGTGGGAQEGDGGATVGEEKEARLVEGRGGAVDGRRRRQVAVADERRQRSEGQRRRGVADGVFRGEQATSPRRADGPEAEGGGGQAAEENDRSELRNAEAGEHHLARSRTDRCAQGDQDEERQGGREGKGGNGGGGDDDGGGASRSEARTERCCSLRARWDRAWRSRCRTLSGGAATKSTTARSPTRRTRSGRRCGTTRRHLEASVLSASRAILWVTSTLASATLTTDARCSWRSRPAMRASKA